MVLKLFFTNYREEYLYIKWAFLLIFPQIFSAV